MSKLSKICYLPLLVLLLAVIVMAASYPVAAQEEKIELSSQFPVLGGPSGMSFEFQVAMKYTGNEARTFDLFAEGPPGWYLSVQPAFGEAGREISAIRIEPEKTYPDTVKVLLSPTIYALPEPGEYTVTMEASSGELNDKIELKAIITAKYELYLRPALERYNTTATSGEDSHYSILLMNTGTADIENITFSSDKPGGWNITFTPEKVDFLAAGQIQEIDVTITPTRKAIAGDYSVDLRISSQDASDWMDVRVTVLVPTIWGWVGAGIVVVIIIILGVIFVRLGRR